jgi:uncharacterized membrane protein HdeD (DUF308 family)
MIGVISKRWWVFTLRGLVALTFGAAVLSWPILTLHTMVFLFGFFALLDAGLTIFTSLAKANDRGRWPLMLEGVVGLAVCGIVLVYSNIGSMLAPRVEAIMLIYYIAGWAILTGILKTITAFRLRQEIEGEWVLSLSGVVSILTGAALIPQAGSGALAVAWWIGVFAILLGVLLIFGGLKFRGPSLVKK